MRILKGVATSAFLGEMCTFVPSEHIKHQGMKMPERGKLVVYTHSGLVEYAHIYIYMHTF